MGRPKYEKPEPPAARPTRKVDVEEGEVTLGGADDEIKVGKKSLLKPISRNTSGTGNRV